MIMVFTIISTDGMVGWHVIIIQNSWLLSDRLMSSI